MADVHLLTVFGGQGCVGNPTGVVQLPAPVDPIWAQRFAAQLGLPDTAFVWPAPSRAWGVRFFSPATELKVCYQALIGAAHILGGARVPFALLDRASHVEHSADIGWVVTPRSELRPGRERVRAPEGHPCQVVDAGRKRAYAQVDALTFDTFTLDPEAAMRWLRANALVGLCLFHERAPGQLRLRVFTESLDGREDVATGGAVAGLPLVLGCDGEWSVEQGRGAPHRRGMILLRSDGSDVRVGGRCEHLVRGQRA